MITNTEVKPSLLPYELQAYRDGVGNLHNEYIDNSGWRLLENPCMVKLVEYRPKAYNNGFKVL